MTIGDKCLGLIGLKSVKECALAHMPPNSLNTNTWNCFWQNGRLMGKHVTLGVPTNVWPELLV